MKEGEIEKLVKNIHELQSEIRRLAADEPFDELFKIIHHPGWTTIAEGTLVNSLVDSMRAQVKVLASTQKALLAGSREVGLEAGVR